MERYDWNATSLIGDFLFSWSRPERHNNTVITMFIAFTKTDVQSVAFDLKKMDLLEMATLNLSTRDDSRVGCRSRWQGTKKKKAEALVFLVWWENHTDLVNLCVLLDKWTLVHDLNRLEWPHRWIYKQPVKLMVLSLQLISSTGSRDTLVYMSTRWCENPLSCHICHSLLTRSVGLKTHVLQSSPTSLFLMRLMLTCNMSAGCVTNKTQSSTGLN